MPFLSLGRRFPPLSFLRRAVAVAGMSAHPSSFYLLSNLRCNNTGVGILVLLLAAQSAKEVTTNCRALVESSITMTKKTLQEQHKQGIEIL